MAWFGWRQEGPPAGLVPVFAAGGIVGPVVAVTGAIVASHGPRGTAVLHERTAFHRDGIVVGVEIALARGM